MFYFLNGIDYVIEMCIIKNEVVEMVVEVNVWY